MALRRAPIDWLGECVAWFSSAGVPSDVWSTAMPDTTVVTFVTSLRHPATTDEYGRVEELLADTLRSLDGQTDRRCRAIVVANRSFAVPADIRMPVEVVTVDFPEPPDWAGPTQLREAGVRLDKGSKLAVAVSRVSGGHVMYVDADDAVSRRLVAYVAANANRSGWFVERGVRYDVRNGVFRYERRFNDFCGTSLIFDRALLPTFTIPRLASRADVLAIVGEDRVLYEFGSHRHLRRRYRLEPLPFAGAAYCVNNGQNVSSQFRFALGLPLTRALAEDFGLQRKDPAAMWRAVGMNLALVSVYTVLHWLRRRGAAAHRRLFGQHRAR